MAEFRVYKRGERVPQKSIERDEMLARVETFLKHSEKGMAYFRDKERQKKFRSAKVVYDRVRTLSEKAPVGRILRVERGEDKDQLAIVKLDRLAVPDLGCHPAIEKAHALLWKKFGEDKLRSAGRWYCRYVDGTKTVSRHGYLAKPPGTWKGAAEDVFGEGNLNSLAGLKTIADYLVSRTGAGVLTLDTVIYGDRVWRSTTGWGPYTGDFHSHVHFDVTAGRACTP